MYIKYVQFFGISIIHTSIKLFLNKRKAIFKKRMENALSISRLSTLHTHIHLLINNPVAKRYLLHPLQMRKLRL